MLLGRILDLGWQAMARKLRFTPEGGALFEVTCRTLQSRLLLRPSPALNEIIVGVLARAQRLYPVDLIGYTFLSNHFHLLVWVQDSDQLAQFMRYLNSNLAREVARWTGWADKVFARRYDAILVSEEEGAQVGRLEYLLSQGCKEGLVARPQDWPGVHAIEALLTGQPVEGTWFDRAKESRARNRGEQPSPEQYVTRESLSLSPLPCWKSLSPEQYRERVREMLRKIELDQAAARAGQPPLGVEAILAQDPFTLPKQTKKSPAPRFHAISQRVRQELSQAYSWFLAAFRDAAERLKAGDRLVAFPSGSFPPGLPFVGI
jgi:REP element-mobilizing transposase RayT